MDDNQTIVEQRNKSQNSFHQKFDEREVVDVLDQ